MAHPSSLLSVSWRLTGRASARCTIPVDIFLITQKGDHISPIRFNSPNKEGITRLSCIFPRMKGGEPIIQDSDKAFSIEFRTPPVGSQNAGNTNNPSNPNIWHSRRAAGIWPNSRWKKWFGKGSRAFNFRFSGYSLAQPSRQVGIRDLGLKVELLVWQVAIVYPRCILGIPQHIPVSWVDCILTGRKLDISF